MNPPMISLSNRSQRRYLAASLSIFFIFFICIISQPALPTIHSDSATPSTTNTTNPPLTPSAVQRLIIENAPPRVSDHVSFTPLRSLCASTKWQTHVYISCIHNVGGLLNVRNMVLNCVRYAIAAGATGLLLPRIEVRDQTNLTHLRTGKYVDMEYLFDVNWFKNTMLASCEQMVVLNGFEDVPGYGYAIMPDLVNMQTLMGQQSREWRNEKVTDFRDKFDKFLASLSSQPSEKSPVIIRWDDKILFSYPPYADPPELAQNFGSLLDFRPDLSAVANLVLGRLHQRLGSAGYDQTKTSQDRRYLGLHLRSEADTGRRWTTYSTLAQNSLSAAVEDGIRLIYVASGDLPGIKKLTAEALELGILVVDKWSMLNGNEKEYLKDFGVDQLAEVDYLVVLRASRFVGSAYSSFSSSLALRRRRKIWGNFTEPRGVGDRLLGRGGKFTHANMQWPWP